MKTIREMLCCRCRAIICDPDGEVVTFLLPELNCPDMTGAIELARMCNPNVKAILTYAGGRPDAFYFYQQGEWVFVDGARPGSAAPRLTRPMA